MILMVNEMTVNMRQYTPFYLKNLRGLLGSGSSPAHGPKLEGAFTRGNGFSLTNPKVL